MKANIDNDGKLIAPRNIERARVRLQQLDHEIKKLGDQVAGRALGEALPRAKACLEYLNSERTQLVDWITDQEKSDIVYENDPAWVFADRKSLAYPNGAYVVFVGGAICAESDSAYTFDSDGYSIAVARCDYLAKRAKEKGHAKV